VSGREQFAPYSRLAHGNEIVGKLDGHCGHFIWQNWIALFVRRELTETYSIIESNRIESKVVHCLPPVVTIKISKNHNNLKNFRI